MIDTHCHIDAYPDPYATALATDRAGVLTIAVTNLPSAFIDAYPHVRPLRHLRLAVGLHPLFADRHSREKPRFLECLARTSYVGEVGLDFSREGIQTRDLQLESFRFVLEAVREQPKFVTLHSRRAEAQTLDLLEEIGVDPVVFHWYSGPLRELDRLLAMGHFCSINPAMLTSKHGKAVISRLPRERILAETDGPYVTVDNRPAIPPDVALVEQFLAEQWACDIEAVRTQVRNNLRAAIPPQADDEMGMSS